MSAKNYVIPIGAAVILTGIVIANLWQKLDAPANAKQEPVAPAGTPQPVPVTVTPVQPGAIDWDQALADIAAQREEAGDTGLAQIAAAGDPSPVPVLMPSGIVTPQSAAPPRYKGLEDGYFATFQGVKYDIVMNGTVSKFATGDTPDAERPEYVFTATDSGAQLAFSRYGADYLIEFECNVLEEGLTCIDRDEAIQVAEELVVTGGR